MKLLVFSDDWGRHPSSCQHLIRQLLPEHDVTWVNTIGMRPPRLDLITAKRGAEKVAGWMRREQEVASGKGRVGSNETEGVSQRSTLLNSQLPAPSSPHIIDAKMWPWMTRKWDRWLNRNLLSRQLQDAFEDAIAITTIPIVADLVGQLPVKRWVYYCVDDFSVWPGLDGKLLGRMEDELIAKVDRVIAVSETLVDSLAKRGCTAELLTHGVDIDFWRNPRGDQGNRPILEGDGLKSTFAETDTQPPSRHSSLAATLSPTPELPDSQTPPLPHSPTALFWGVVDRRMNADWVLRLADSLEDGQIVLAGPKQDPDERLLNHPRISLPGPVRYDELPALAAKADVLIMPYADLPVTRAMQPLKMKEYLATGRPVVVSDLPAVRPWSEFLQIAKSGEDFVQQVHRLMERRPQDRAEVTDGALFGRLAEESWAAKSDRFLELISAQQPPNGA